MLLTYSSHSEHVALLEFRKLLPQKDEVLIYAERNFRKLLQNYTFETAGVLWKVQSLRLNVVSCIKINFVEEIPKRFSKEIHSPFHWHRKIINLYVPLENPSEKRCNYDKDKRNNRQGE